MSQQYFKLGFHEFSIFSQYKVTSYERTRSFAARKLVFEFVLKLCRQLLKGTHHVVAFCS